MPIAPSPSADDFPRVAITITPTRSLPGDACPPVRANPVLERAIMSDPIRTSGQKSIQGQLCGISRSPRGRKVVRFGYCTRRVHRGHMRRREFIKVIAGVTAAWPLKARAQQSEPKRRVGVLMGLAADDTEAQDRIAAFEQGLQQLGWIDGSNLQIDYRRGAGGTDLTRRYADELVALAPDVILASGGTVVGPLLQATRTVPIVFTQTPDPVAAGFVASLARPAAMPPGLPPPNTASAGNGWSCSRRSRRA